VSAFWRTVVVITGGFETRAGTPCRVPPPGCHKPRRVRNRSRARRSGAAPRVLISPGGFATRPRRCTIASARRVVINPGGFATGSGSRRLWARSKSSSTQEGSAPLHVGHPRGDQRRRHQAMRVRNVLNLSGSAGPSRSSSAQEGSEHAGGHAGDDRRGVSSLAQEGSKQVEVLWQRGPRTGSLSAQEGSKPGDRPGQQLDRGGSSSAQEGSKPAQ
jgi:hypothetical protein